MSAKVTYTFRFDGNEFQFRVVEVDVLDEGFNA